MKRSTTAVIFGIIAAAYLAPSGAFAQFSNGYLIVDMDPKRALAKEGFGFDSGSLEPLSTKCMQFNGAGPSVPDKGQSDFKVLKTVNDIKSTFNISYRTAMTELTSEESESTSFGEALHLNDDKVTGVFHKIFTISPQTINPTQLAPGLPKDPSEFRRICGDYYVAGFTRGYEFHGFVEVSKSLFNSDTSFETKLQETIDAGLAKESSDVDAKATLNMMFSSKRVTAREDVTGGGLQAMKGTDLKTVMADYQNFPPKGSKPTNLKVIVAPYPPSAPKMESPDEALLEENAKLWVEFYELGKWVEGTKTDPGLYYFFDASGQPIKKTAAASTGALVNAIKDRIALQIQQCQGNTSKCRSMRASLTESETPELLRTVLPVYVGYAMSCTEMAQIIRTAFKDNDYSPADGRYTLYFDRNPKWDYVAYCDDINGSARTYFTFGTPGRAPVAAGPNSREREGINYFQIAPSSSSAKEKWYDGTLVMSVYDMVEIDPVTMQVVNAVDDLGRHDNGGSIHTSSGGFTNVGFGKVSECDDAVADLAKGRIDLKRTNFRVSERSTLNLGGYNWSGGNVSFQEDRQVVVLSSPKGNCASVDPSLFFEPKSDLQQ
jgi:hypothetical protein